jgi:hypothetical protein
MNWTQMLLEAGIPEPPGRDEAYRQAALLTEERYKHNGNKRAQGSNTRKTTRKPAKRR